MTAALFLAACDEDSASLPAGAPADVFAPLPSSDAEWASCGLVDKLLGGWASDVHYRHTPTAEEIAENGGADPRSPRPLGALADELLTNPTHMEAILTWLVTDHKEADTADGAGGHDVFRSATDVVCSQLGPSRRWPSQPGHNVEFKDFELRHAQLFKGLAAFYTADKLLPALMPPLLKRMADTARDAQAVASEVVAVPLFSSAS